ncbi:hypothetical protein [Halorubrum halophilum]|uniref:hypothetical protein n=1 Tax=Halorubrum halophilum TaxID=413816 RepID=UPI00186AD92E|nr:hypothetical protein [Halorubrum halophilum]
MPRDTLVLERVETGEEYTYEDRGGNGILQKKGETSYTPHTEYIDESEVRREGGDEYIHIDGQEYRILSGDVSDWTKNYH